MVHRILRYRVFVGQVGQPEIVLECPSNCGTRDTYFRHRVLVGQVRYPGIVLECPSNYGTQDTQTQVRGGQVGHPGIVMEYPGNYGSYTGHSWIIHVQDSYMYM